MDAEKDIRQRGFLRPGKHFTGYLERASLVQALTQLQAYARPGRILDVGCGVKPYESLLCPPGSRYLGVDYPVTMAGAYRETTRADVFADSLRLPFAEGAFDTAIATQVLEHLGRPVDFLQEIARVLRPGGVLILSAPMTWPLHEEPHDYFRYTIHGLRRLARDAGLEVLAEVPRGGAAATLGQMFLDLYVANPQPVGCLRHTLGKALSLVVNWKCLCLDRLAPRPRLCLGWAIAARKPPSAGRA